MNGTRLAGVGSGVRLVPDGPVGVASVGWVVDLTDVVVPSRSGGRRSWPALVVVGRARCWFELS
jgi:hypothetical protein